MPDSGRPLEIQDIVNIPINIMSTGHVTGTLLFSAGLEFLLDREPQWQERLREDHLAARPHLPQPQWEV
jgi:hypothetical protein